MKKPVEAFVSFISIVDKTVTTLMEFKVTEQIINNNGSHEGTYHKVAHTDFVIKAACNEWTIPITRKTVGIDMPTTMENNVYIGFLDGVVGINTSRSRSFDPVEFNTKGVNIIIYDALVVDDAFRLPAQPSASEGTHKIGGSNSSSSRVLVINEDTWEVEKNELLGSGNYEVTGLQSGLKLVVSRTSEGESKAYGAVAAVSNVEE